MFENWRIIDKQRGHGGTQEVTVAPKPPWTPTIPTAEPWGSVYMRLTRAAQQTWDSMSPAQRRNTFGI